MMPGEDRKAVGRRRSRRAELPCLSPSLESRRARNQVVHRFPNEPVPNARRPALEYRRHLRRRHRVGLRACAALAPEGIAFDCRGWLGRRLRAAECNRYSGRASLLLSRRNERSRPNAKFTACCRHRSLYALTGIQILRINTLYQLYADKLAGFDPAIAVDESSRVHRLSPLRASESANIRTPLIRVLWIWEQIPGAKRFSINLVCNIRSRARYCAERNDPRTSLR